MSFIEKAKVHGANALLGMFTCRAGFDDKFKGLRVEHIADGRVECSLTVEPHIQNAYGTLHGGAVATLIDIVGTMAILSVHPTKAGVSVELSTSFMSPAKSGEKIKIEGTLLRAGRSMAFTNVELRRASDGRLVACGRHTKAI